MPPIFELIAEHGEVGEEEMYEVFNMGCGFCVVVSAADEAAALELLGAHYPGAKRIGASRTKTASSGAASRQLLSPGARAPTPTGSRPLKRGSDRAPAPRKERR